MKKLCTIVMLIAFQSCFSAYRFIGHYCISAEREREIQQECSELGITYNLTYPAWVAHNGTKKEFPLNRVDAYEYLLELKVQVFKKKSADQKAQQEKKEQEAKKRQQEKEQEKLFALGYEADDEDEKATRRKIR